MVLLTLLLTASLSRFTSLLLLLIFYAIGVCRISAKAIGPSFNSITAFTAALSRLGTLHSRSLIATTIIIIAILV